MRSYLGTALLISFGLMLLTCTRATKQPEPEAEATNEADDMAALDGLRGEFIAAYNAGDASTLATLFTLTPKASGTPTDDEGKYLLISRRQPDASWRIARHIWNSNNPVPAPTRVAD